MADHVKCSAKRANGKASGGSDLLPPLVVVTLIDLADGGAVSPLSP